MSFPEITTAAIEAITTLQEQYLAICTENEELNNRLLNLEREVQNKTRQLNSMNKKNQNLIRDLHNTRKQNKQRPNNHNQNKPKQNPTRKDNVPPFHTVNFHEIDPRFKAQLAAMFGLNR